MTSRSLAPGRADLAAPAAGAPPRSRAFDDVYFSEGDGLAETDAVFLEGCGLADAWSRLGAGRHFVIGELGFGTGLNLLAAWRLWRRLRPPGATLHFVSIEGFPLNRDEAAGALAPFPEVADLAAQLLAAWPERIKGVHRRRFDAEGVVLTLAHLEVRDALAALDVAADAWFLDGFAPARNPDMWSQDVLDAVAMRSKPGARLATFTVAGSVRRGLEAAGFTVEKKPGHGRKRERLEAVLHRPSSAPMRSPLSPRATAPDGPVLILGAGVAGASAARALTRRGVETRVLEAGSTPASGASGNPLALVAPRLDFDDHAAARFHRAAYAYALAEYASSETFRAIGIMRAGKNAADTERIGRLLEAEALPPDMLRPVIVAEAGPDLGVKAATTGALLPQAGVLTPHAWIAEALQGSDLRCEASVARLEYDGGVWIARDAEGAMLGEGAACVIATGPALARFPQTRFLALTRSRGQITLAHVEAPRPAHAFAWGPYFAPMSDGRVVAGATYDPWDAEDAPNPRAEDDVRNLDALAAFAPLLAARVDRSALEARSAVRAATADRLPLAGAVVDDVAFRKRFAALAHGRTSEGPPAEVRAGLYVLGGLGSRGFVWGPLLGEALASEMRGEPGALESETAAALHPARDLVRELKRSRDGG